MGKLMSLLSPRLDRSRQPAQYGNQWEVAHRRHACDSAHLLQDTSRALALVLALLKKRNHSVLNSAIKSQNEASQTCRI